MSPTVLHLSSSSGPGGAEAMMASLASGLDRSGYRSIVCLFRDGWLRERCERLGLETRILRMSGMLDLGWLRRFISLLRERGVTLIHAHEFDANAYGTLAGRLAGVPVVATVHGRSYYADRRRRRLTYRAVSRGAAMVAVSDDVKRFVVAATGVSAARVRVVHNGIEAAPVVSHEARTGLRTALGLRTEEQVVTVVGSLYPVKGHRHLLGAAPEILAARPSTVFLIVGRGECEAALKEEARRLGVDSRVRFLGLRDDVAALLAISDVFVLPSLSEGLSIAILEAMVAGRPVVTTRVGGNPELVVHGETGFLVPPNDAAALASAVVRVLEDPAEAHRLGQNGLGHVRRHFSIDAMLRAYEAIYAELLRSPALPSRWPGWSWVRGGLDEQSASEAPLPPAPSSRGGER
jgi:glycosyltransferase involved in cell wall biosynthesis